MDIKKICFDLASKAGTSGDEREAALFAKSELEKYMDVKIDTLGNVVGPCGNGAPHILLDAHIDQIGLVIRGITDKGFLLVDKHFLSFRLYTYVLYICPYSLSYSLIFRQYSTILRLSYPKNLIAFIIALYPPIYGYIL